MASPSPEELAYMRAHADDDLRPNIYACVACCLIFPYIAVGLRFIARRRMNVPIKTDDYLALAALLPLTGMNVGNIFAAYSGLGRHIIYAKNLTVFAKTFISGEVTYSCTIVLAKLSVLFLYRRLFPSKELTIYSILVAILVLGYSTALIVVSFTQCTPLYKLWRPETPGHCINTKAAYVTTGAMNVITDILILLLPLRFIWGLQMKTSRKLQIVGLFISGGIVCVFGIIRCYYVSTVSVTDQTWSGTQGAVWSEVEMAVATICACLPTLRPIFVRRSELSQFAKSASGSGLGYIRRTRDDEITPQVYSYKAWASSSRQPESVSLDERPLTKVDAA